ncbi:hydrogenase 1 maturation protease [mine drainage metagenome]|uniref:Hydrogenase 1 maturation protease n=1 Tax=mine drainage metagenome TaxID=410659 RepID=A0A1J5S1J5_9ZZZZ
MKTLVLGLGNTLLRDEGVGVVATNALRARHGESEGLAFVDGGTLSFALAGIIAETDALIVLDAAELGEPPGTVRCWIGEAMDRFLGSSRQRSVHEVALLDLMALALLEDRLPPRRALIAVQPGTIAWGETLGPAVAAAVASMCEQASALIGRWRHLDRGEH